ncbi:MAG: methionyl-tRNA formyltransferase [Candidatus Marinimicrobia bacterium]|nr:methionyl-tRNA formyltransferase [Candidatus Neomarinimicrobiota bacterium]
MNIAFFGTPDFAVPALCEINNSNHNIVATITGVAKPSGRGQKLRKTPIYVESERLKIPIIEVDDLHDSDFIKKLESLKIDIFIIVAFRILPEKIFSIPKYGTVNLHASLLPKYRGSAPIQHAILNGETKTGITTFQINSRVDAGNIYLQEEYIITNIATTGMVWDDLSIVGASLLVKTLDGIENNSISPTKQDLQKSSPAPKLKSEMFSIDWSKSSTQIHNQIRAFSPKPGAFTKFNGLRIKLFDSEVTNMKTLKSGLWVNLDDKIVVGTGNGDLEIKSVQLEGKKRMSTADFYKGILSKIEGRELSFG